MAYPTPEAYTFRGWAYSMFGGYDRAMFECFQAVKLDPEFGNPYNDIGKYMIQRERWDEAIEWFERAIDGKRYASRWCPHFYLGRIYEHKHDWAKAKTHFAKAVAIDQHYTAALAGVARMRACHPENLRQPSTWEVCRRVSTKPAGSLTRLTDESRFRCSLSPA